MKIDRLNTGRRNQEVLIGYFKEREQHKMVKWLSDCIIRFDTYVECGRSEKIIVEIYVKDAPEPDFDSENTEEENALVEALRNLCNAENYSGFYLFQLDGRLWRKPERNTPQPRKDMILPPAPHIDTDHEVGLNNCFFPSNSIVEHDELKFRSPAEVSVYKELRKRDLLVFPNAAAVLGCTGEKREPDFLICHKGKWGVLEVMGATYHTNAVKDHNRGRLFKEHGLLCIEFFPAAKCETEAAAVVDEFLALLAKH